MSEATDYVTSFDSPMRRRLNSDRLAASAIRADAVARADRNRADLIAEANAIHADAYQDAVDTYNRMMRVAFGG